MGKDTVDLTKSFTDQFSPKPPSMKMEEKATKRMSAWGHIPTKLLFARNQLANALADAGADELAEAVLAPESEDLIARMAEVLKRAG